MPRFPREATGGKIMAKKDKFSDKLKEGVSVEEIESFARKYTSEVFAAIAIIIASISSAFDFFTGPGWSLLLAGLGAVVGIIFPGPVESFLAKCYSFVQKQEKSTQIIIGVVRIIIGLFIPFVIFTMMGLLAGSSYHEHMKHPYHSMRGDSRSKDRDDEHL
jgi:hypothetical protein